MEENLQKNENELLNTNKGGNKKVIIAILVVIIISLIGAVVYFVFIKKDDKPVDNTNNDKQQVDNIDVPKEIRGSLNVYCRLYYDDCWLTTDSNEAGELFYTIETETENPTVVDKNATIILFNDNGLKFFTKKDKKSRKINLEHKYNIYNIVSTQDGDLIGIVYKNDEISGYFDYKTNKTLYDKGKLLNDSYNERYILYLTDNKISIYDKQDSKIVKENINLNPDYSDYRVMVEREINDEGVGIDKKLIGIFASNESNGESIYYNLEKNKTMYKNTYSSMYLDENNDYLVAQKDLNTGASYDTIDYILDPKEEKIVFAPSDPKKHMSFYLQKYNGKYYFVESTDLVEPHYYTKGIIYSNEKKLIAEVRYSVGDYKGQEYMFNDHGELFITKDNTISKYNIDGELLDSKTYEKVINIVAGYLIVVNDGKLVMLDSNFKQISEIIEWKDSYKFDYYPPNYLVENTLSDNPKKDFVSGIYMVLEDGNNYTEYCFNPKSNKLTSRKINNIENYDLSIYWADLS